MKKFFVLFFSIALLTACSEDDNSATDPVVGKWFVAEVNNIPGSDFTLSECNTKSFMTFNADGTANSVFYAQAEGICLAGTPTNSEWSEQVGIYSLTIPIPELEAVSPLSGTIQFNADTFTFTPIISPGTTIVFKKG
ncbi:MAG: lipocalin family protein [Gillisia sp.]|nr:lipocalin family protein [Gillisia sp.]